MPFIADILKYKSLSIVGLDKNTGKTECLNYILRRLKNSNKKIALTSIGIDGEGIDQVTKTHKPEIEVYEDTIIITSEKHYQKRCLVSEIMDISKRSTSLGRLITAKAKGTGKLMFSGPADTIWLKEIINRMQNYDVDTTIVDGALSRLSLSSPAITDSMVLATGAAVSVNIKTLVKKTKFVYDLINIEEYVSSVKDTLLAIDKGIWAIDKDGNVHDLNIPSVFLLEKKKNELFNHGTTIYVSGVVSDKLLNFLRIQKNVKDIVLIAKDFTRIFVTPESYSSFLKKGGNIRVLCRTNLIAVTINPVAPSGYKLDSDLLSKAMSDSLKIPVYDIKKL